MEFGFISHKNLRIVIHRAINHNPCPVSTVSTVTCFMQYFVVVAVLLVFENSDEISAAQFILPKRFIDVIEMFSQP